MRRLIYLLLIMLMLVGCASNTSPAAVVPAAPGSLLSVPTSGHSGPPVPRAWVVRDIASIIAGLDGPASLDMIPRVARQYEIPAGEGVPQGTSAPTPAQVVADATQAPLSAEGVSVPAATRFPALPPTAVVEEGTAFSSTAPTAAVPTRPAADVLAPWAQPIVAWNVLEMNSIARNKLAPTRAARDLALLNIALNDSYYVADAARAKGLPVSEDALLATTGTAVLTYLHPFESELWEQANAVALWTGVWAGKDTPAGVATSVVIGQRVAQTIIDRFRADGSDAPQQLALPAPAPGIWQPTPPDRAWAIDPQWGKVKTVALTETATLAVAAPPAWDSGMFQAERTAWKDTQAKLTDEQRGIAQKWAGAAGSVTPAGLWMKIARKLVAEAKLDNRRAAQVYAALAVTMHNAFIVCWQGKYQYLVERPITWVRERDASWSPLFITPPFPSYPSGHATISAAAADVLSAFFPDQAQMLEHQAEEAATSRVYAGIHWKLDSDAGLDQGHRVGQAMLALMR